MCILYGGSPSRQSKVITKTKSVLKKLYLSSNVFLGADYFHLDVVIEEFVSNYEIFKILVKLLTW